MKYSKPKAELVRFQNEDIIATSGEAGGCNNLGLCSNFTQYCGGVSQILNDPGMGPGDGPSAGGF